jgi:hypothetical protein
MLCGIAFSDTSGRSRGKSNPATEVGSVLCSHEDGGFVGRIVDRNRLRPGDRNAVCLRSRSPHCLTWLAHLTRIRKRACRVVGRWSAIRKQPRRSCEIKFGESKYKIAFDFEMIYVGCAEDRIHFQRPCRAANRQSAFDRKPSQGLG